MLILFSWENDWFLQVNVSDLFIFFFREACGLDKRIFFGEKNFCISRGRFGIFWGEFFCILSLFHDFLKYNCQKSKHEALFLSPSLFFCVGKTCRIKKIKIGFSDAFILGAIGDFRGKLDPNYFSFSGISDTSLLSFRFLTPRKYFIWLE